MMRSLRQKDFAFSASIAAMTNRDGGLENIQ
jgi:hypothetical protein